MLHLRWPTQRHNRPRAYQPFDPAVFREHLKELTSRELFGIDTFADIARYKLERENAKLDVQFTGSAAICKLTDTLDAAQFNIPLTIVVSAPGARSASAQRDGIALSAKLLDGNVLVDATPGPKPIVVNWQ